jgi:glutathione S-transferase
MAVATLFALPLSPWSEKARWALDHHGIGYVEKSALPTFGAPLLRWRLRRLRGRITFPLLYDGRGGLCLDPLDIARFAERTGGGTPLFRRGQEEEVARWHQLSEEALRAAQDLSGEREAERPVVVRPQALATQALATMTPRGLAGLLVPAARVAVRFLQRRSRWLDGGARWGSSRSSHAPDASSASSGFDPDESPHRARLRRALLELRRALSDGRRYLVGDALSYCDIAMAVALMGVEPADAPHLPFTPAARRSATDLVLAGEFTDLLGWRDELYAEHRRPEPRSAAEATRSDSRSRR